MKVAIEDLAEDVIAKSQAGLGKSDQQLAAEAGVSLEELMAIKEGEFNETVALKVAGPLNLFADALLELGAAAWEPSPISVNGLHHFNSPFPEGYDGMTVNSYAVTDPQSGKTIIFDSGADATGLLAYLESPGVIPAVILLTHTHPDHIKDLDRIKAATGADVLVHKNEQIPGASTIEAGSTIDVGSLKIEARLTDGHSPGGLTFVISGLERPVAIVGDAVFACSMGGAANAWQKAINNNVEKIMSLPDSTVICPGHGPLTTVGWERLHNPILAMAETNEKKSDGPETAVAPTAVSPVAAKQAPEPLTDGARSAGPVGFVGLGRMGANMARNLADKGYSIACVYDVDKSTTASLADELGCTPAKSLAEVSELSDVVVTCVTDDTAMRGLFKNKRDNLLSKPRGTLFINTATVSPKIHREIEEICASKRSSVIEACMASSIPQARNGELYLMIGGKKRAFERAEAILADLAKEVVYIGESGSAATVKALVNMVMNINTAALAEGLGLGEALGVDPKVLVDVFSKTGAASRVLETDGEDMINRDHDVYFSAAHAAKDSGIAEKLSREARIPCPLNEATLKQYELLVSLGLGDLDKSSIAELTFKGRHFGVRGRKTTEKTTRKSTGKKAAKKGRRGRPRKGATESAATPASDDVGASTEAPTKVTTKKRRGRPPGSKNKASVKKKTATKKAGRRGRPRKVDVAAASTASAVEAVSETTEAPTKVTTKKRRGRPPGSKNKAASTKKKATKKTGRRGRPPGSKNTKTAVTTKKRPGRPRKGVDALEQAALDAAASS